MIEEFEEKKRQKLLKKSVDNMQKQSLSQVSTIYQDNETRNIIGEVNSPADSINKSDDKLKSKVNTKKNKKHFKIKRKRISNTSGNIIVKKDKEIVESNKFISDVKSSLSTDVSPNDKKSKKFISDKGSVQKTMVTHKGKNVFIDNKGTK